MDDEWRRDEPRSIGLPPIGTRNTGQVRDQHHELHGRAPGEIDVELCLIFIESMPGIHIRQIALSELDLIEPLWSALREHHASVTPSLGEPRSRTESWRRRRGQYERWLSAPDAFLLIAERAGAPVGYAMVQLREGSPSWPLSERAGEIETLSVLPSERGNGTGSALLKAVRSQLASHGVTELSLHVMHTNSDAMRFYERHGFEPYAIWVRTGAKDPRGN